MQSPIIPIKNVGNDGENVISGLVDRFQRQYTYLRLSITDVCNFRCTYCLPDGYQPPAHKQTFLTLSEIQRVANAFASLGTEKSALQVANQPYAKISSKLPILSPKHKAFAK